MYSSLQDMYKQPVTIVHCDSINSFNDKVFGTKAVINAAVYEHFETIQDDAGNVCVSKCQVYLPPVALSYNDELIVNDTQYPIKGIKAVKDFTINKVRGLVVYI